MDVAISDQGFSQLSPDDLIHADVPPIDIIGEALARPLVAFWVEPRIPILAPKEFTWLDKCLSALDEIGDVNSREVVKSREVLYSCEHPQGFLFDFKRVFRPWYGEEIPAWPKDSMPEDGNLNRDRWVDVYSREENGPSILAFICREGVVVAGEDASPAVHKFVRFNSHVIGCMAGDATDCELFLKDFAYQGINDSALDVSKWLVDTKSFHNLKGLSGIVIAGWGDEGPSLYYIDGEGILHQGVLFACGSCSAYGYGLLGTMSFPYMSITTAAKVAKIAIPTAIAESKFYDGIDDSDIVDCENGRVGDSVEVYCIGPDGIREADDAGVIREAWQEPKRRKV